MNVTDRAPAGSRTIHKRFLAFHDSFNEVTLRAKQRFERRDWQSTESDALERLNLYSSAVKQTIAELREALGGEFRDARVWTRIKACYSRETADRPNSELAETFLNSVTRRIFDTEGVNPSIEYTSADFEFPDREPADWIVQRYELADGASELVRRILLAPGFDAGFRDLAGDVAAIERRIAALLERSTGQSSIDGVEVLRPVFYRMKHAYIVGRLRSGGHTFPFILPLLHDEQGIFADAVLMDESQASILFSFTRAYFHVEAENPLELILFLQSFLPQKPVAELYISLGFNKHGKTALYRDLRHYLDHSNDSFEIASGDRGLVMVVFTLPGYDMVFKIIRDRFAYPKNTSAREVMSRYRIVFERDRVGRLVEAQEFEHLKFRRDRFSEELIEELTGEAAQSVTFEDEHVVIEHVYTERRVRPLNLFLRENNPTEVERAVIDYGDAIKELAAANIFAGDFLLKNFGVTRQGRVVFYDYDELCLLTDCRFRRLPPPRNPEDEMSAVPWFNVGENDVFPEEFRNFLGLPRPLLDLFELRHGDVFTPEFWKELQRRHESGEILDFYPYSESARLRS